MDNMFFKALSFDQDLSNWNIGYSTTCDKIFLNVDSMNDYYLPNFKHCSY